MTLPDLAVVPALGIADVVVVGATSGTGGPELLRGRIPESVASAIAAQLPLIGFSAAPDELVRLVVDGAVYGVIGLGGKIGVDALRAAAGSAIRQLAGVGSVAFALPIEQEAELRAVLTGAALGAYGYSGYKARDAKAPVSAVAVVADIPADAAVARAVVDASAVALVKDLVNAPPLDLYPETLVAASLEAVASLPIATRVWDESQLAADGFGGIGGVGQGSARPPRLLKLSYEPAGAVRHVALVGKGITFDSGGLSLKTGPGMVGMKTDMAGAASVLATIRAAAELALPVRVTAWLCIAENMPSGTAIRPNDVLRIRGGKTVEVLNTDAEGRLVLADGLVAASEEHPDELIDIATLTGAKITALGTRYSAAMGSDALVSAIRNAAAAEGELLWPMPLPDELRPTIASQVADIANANPGVAAGGMLLAGVFLREFVGTAAEGDDAAPIPWAHLDIAGSDENKGGAYGFTGKGPTAVLVRTLIAHLADSGSVLG
ncbi:leucyl aminopeptidase [Gryllotalpicola sp.]|uniref:leucyl aminopeptidase n=1 Tax=Gryllotalpicola sp. TaxID=1932787 RepID=UPI00262BA777|nr:leucyl aminopeptidase [Gryllotalpicola sp.]